MTLTEILEFILLPVNGWLLFNSLRNAERLTRIETLVKYMIESKRTEDRRNENDDDES